jgi:DNA-binding response OmpR family regulator
MSKDKSSDSNVKPKVLIAEDNPVVRKGLVNFLIKWGYEPIEVENGDDAWRVLEEDKKIRLAIVDWNLPGLSGIQVCQRLRVNSDIPYVYTIIFSSRKSKEEQVLALDGGADDYLVKPCKPSELRARLGVGRRIIETALAATGEPAADNDSGTEEKN